MKARLLLILMVCILPLHAHVMSMSTGDISVQGSKAHYELRMPIYEITGMKDPGAVLLDHIRFSTAGQAGRLTQKTCGEDAAQGSLICTAEYEFPIPVDRLDVECSYHSVTVPNHVHLLRAQKEGKSDQAIF